MTLRAKVTGLIHVGWIFWVSEPIVGDHALADSGCVDPVAHGNDLTTDIRTLNAREDNGVSAPGGIVGIHGVERIARGRIRYGFRIPTRARVHVSVV